jgi:FkbM family methyltransferase
LEKDLYSLNDRYQEALRTLDGLQRDRAVLDLYAANETRTLLSALANSKSQLRQDFFALGEVNFKRGGFFVEFGACDGVHLSNTHLLEKEFGWTGILAEPARVWHGALARNRSCRIETRCVWRTSGETMRFNEVDESGLSTIDAFSADDMHSEDRKSGHIYEVESISLVDMLDQNGAPPVIDYLSIDTEGSEFDILNAFDFDKYKFRAITCEHNYTERREDIKNLLESKGYVRRHEGLSLFDDWYVASA